MSADFISFDDIRSRVEEALGSAPMPESAPPVQGISINLASV